MWLSVVCILINNDTGHHSRQDNLDNFHILPLKSVIPNFVTCLVFLGMAFSFIKFICFSDTLTKREAAILKICPPAIITSAEVSIVEYDPILGQ